MADGSSHPGFVAEGGGERPVEHEAPQLTALGRQVAVGAGLRAREFDGHEEAVSTVFGASQFELYDFDTH